MARLPDGKRKVTVSEILAREDVKDVLSEFMSEDLADADRILIIWTNKEGVQSRYCGFSNNLEMLGAMKVVENDLLNEDMEDSL